MSLGLWFVPAFIPNTPSAFIGMCDLMDAIAERADAAGHRRLSLDEEIDFLLTHGYVELVDNQW
jgi:hypothetical protein